MADITSSSILTWFSRLKQTAYGTAIAAAGPFRRLGETNRVLFDVVPNFTPDTENNGSDEAVGNYVTTNTFRETALETYFSFQDIMYWIQMIMGVVNSTGSAIPYTHVGSALNKASSRQHPVRTFGQRKGSDILIYPDVGLKEVRIAKDSQGIIKVTITPHGSGKVLTNPTSYVVPSAVSDRVRGYNNQAGTTLNDSAASLSKAYKCGIESWEWTFTNEPVGDGFRDCSPDKVTGKPALGQIRSEWFTSKYNWKFTFQTRLATDDVARSIMELNDFLEVTTTITSTEKMTDAGNTPFSATIDDTKVKISAIEDTPQEGGFILRQVTCDCFADKSTGNMATTVTVVNDVPSYVV